ncbi:hypothetical protein N2152v2_003404 [Parachlorella kessleri]
MAELQEGPYIWIQHSKGYAGTYTSYECDPSSGKGGYKSTVRYGGISPKGVPRLDSYDTCEVGKIDLQARTYQWNSDSHECPTDFAATATLVALLLWGRDGSSGLTGAGHMAAGATCGGISAVRTSSNPADLILQLQTGAYTSYECDPSNGKGAYKATLRHSVISPDGTATAPPSGGLISQIATLLEGRSDSGGFTTCELGKIDLQVGTFLWSDSQGNCPTGYGYTAHLINSTL